MGKLFLGPVLRRRGEIRVLVWELGIKYHWIVEIFETFVVH